MTGSPAPERQDRSPEDTLPRRWSLTRAVAVAVLLPSVPLLALSVAALALFYARPERFDAYLQQLPGTDFLRLVLIFAPATLFAIVVMAVLYAREGPPAGREAVPAALPRRAIPNQGAIITVVLGVSSAGLLASVALTLLSFVAPGRFGALTAELPGQAYIRSVVRYAPFVCLFVALLAFSFLLERRPRPERRGERDRSPRLARAAAGLVLLPALPMLLLSSSGLVLFYAKPDWADRLLAHLGTQAFVRAGLIFAPTTLIALVILAILYLRQSTREGVTQPRAGAQPTENSDAGSDRLVWLLAGGLGLSSIVVLGLLAALLYLLLR